MSIIKCYECLAKLSDKASACPHCGAPSKKISNQNSSTVFLVKQILAVGLIFFGAFMSAGFFIGGESEDSFTVDFIVWLLLGILPIFLGFKLFNQTNIIIVLYNWLNKLFRS